MHSNTVLTATVRAGLQNSGMCAVQGLGLEIAQGCDLDLDNRGEGVVGMLVVLVAVEVVVYVYVYVYGYVPVPVPVPVVLDPKVAVDTAAAARQTA